MQFGDGGTGDGSRSIPVIILCGGMGTRLREETVRMGYLPQANFREEIQRTLVVAAGPLGEEGA